MSDTYVYRAFDQDGRLLYVGMTGNLANRWAEHRTGSLWSSLMAGYRIVGPFATREAAARYERQAIQTEQPAYNIQHIPAHKCEPVDIAVIHEVSKRTGISSGVLQQAYSIGQLGDFSDSSLLDWVCSFPTLREIAANHCRRRRRPHLHRVKTA